MNQDGVRNGYDITQLNIMLTDCDIPLIASGGAGTREHFADVLTKTRSSGALAASVFHKNIININELKDYLRYESINIRY
jgi:cyclase